MFKSLLFIATLAFTSVFLSACSDEQDNQMGQDRELNADPEWSENPYGEEEADNPQPRDEINRNQDDVLNKAYPEEDPSSLEEATEQGISQQY